MNAKKQRLVVRMLSIMLVSLAGLLLGMADKADATVIKNAVFLEINNDVKVTFQLEDKAASPMVTFDDLPETFRIVLLERDNVLPFDDDDFLGSATVNVTQALVTQAGAGWTMIGTTNSFMITYLNASNAFTGSGDDYFLELEQLVPGIPEPSTVLLLGSGLVALARLRRGRKTR